jgi:transcriptional regulator with XRE-family HTH domain
MKTPNTYAIFPGRLKAARALRGLSINDLVLLTYISSGHLMRLETGVRKPSCDSLARLSRALKVTIDYLLGIVDDPTAISDVTARMEAWRNK